LTQDCHLQLESEPKKEDIDFIWQGLERYNLQYAPEGGFSRLVLTLRNGAGQLVGGLLGEIYWGWLHISILWLEEDVRGKGFGRKLVQAAEQEARQRGCHAVNLDTLDFQALPFYEKLGYTIFGLLEDHPVGHTRYFLQKKLD
jgi:GNAT superfamily N-acetyltransferase